MTIDDCFESKCIPSRTFVDLQENINRYKGLMESGERGAEYRDTESDADNQEVYSEVVPGAVGMRERRESEGSNLIVMGVREGGESGAREWGEERGGGSEPKEVATGSTHMELRCCYLLRYFRWMLSR